MRRRGSGWTPSSSAVTELGLPDNDSYTTFVDLKRDYVVWNVVAAEPFSVDPVQWCFPIAGCVSYRGYFDRDKAEKFARKLEAKGYDTYSGGSGAYSTLGYFADPVVNTMIAGSDVDLARILFHELAHQRLYIKGDSDLSEAFASAVEDHGIERLLAERHDTAAAKAYRERRRRGEQVTELIERQRDRLRAIYAQDEPAAQLLELKADAFATMQKEYMALRQRWGGRGEFDGWFEGKMNNARLAAISTYRKWLPGLRWRLEQVGLETFFAEVAALEDLPEDARLARLQAWNQASQASFRANLGQSIPLPAEVLSGDSSESSRRDSEMGKAVARADTGNAERAQVVQ
jgi:predicted aminopeptidase